MIRTIHPRPALRAGQGPAAQRAMVCVALAAFGLLCSTLRAADVAPAPAISDEQRAKDDLFIETLSRLEGVDINANEKLKTRLLAVLGRNKGTSAYVEMAARFNLRDLSDELVKLAVEKPTDSAGVAAAKQLIKWDELARLKKVVDTGVLPGGSAAPIAPDSPPAIAAASAALTALGYTSDAKAWPVIEAVIADDKRAKPVRTAAIAAMGLGRAGEKRLLELAKAGKLSDDLHFAAGNVLLASTDPTIQAEAGKHLKLPPSVNSKPLPPIAQLAQRTGDASNGPRVFKKINCIQCHRVAPAPGNGAAGEPFGADFGPALSEIGSKLPKDALYTAILDPSAGIEHNYEGTRIETDDGEDIVGIVVSDTADLLTLKLPGGVQRKYAKSSILARDKIKSSLMPQGLQLAMTEQELVDLVEWLSGLKKK